MGQALYRKHRPKHLGDVVGQEHVTDTLAMALKSGRISHAYLFSGPRGVGKTSIARILAHELNGFQYTGDNEHLDIIEIDAASNRRIDEIRELRDKVYIAPTAGKYKIYIIDEVHMLTREAFNALLKTLEEPPAHAVFILATTEAHKLPETIVSRTQHFTFKPVEPQKVVDHLRNIADSEGVQIDDDALALLAAHGEGSFRDSISVLDQMRNTIIQDSKKITVNDVRQLLGIAPEESIEGLILSLASGKPSGELLVELNELYRQGIQAAAIANQLAGTLRASLGDSKLRLPLQHTLDLLTRLIDVPASRDPNRLLEIFLMSVNPVATPAPVASERIDAIDVQAAKTAIQPAKLPKADEVEPQPKTTEVPKTVKISDPPESAAPDSEAVTETEAPADVPEPSGAADMSFDESLWPDILDEIKKKYNTIYGILRMAHPIFSGGTLELQFKFPFHQKRLNEVKNRQIMIDTVKQLSGKDVEVVCTYNRESTPLVRAKENSASAPGAPDKETMDAINSIFGGAEVINT